MSLNRSDHLAVIADELVDLLDTGRQITPYSHRDPGFDLDQAYRIAEQVMRLRLSRGETVVGRKIGFTNRAVWGDYDISGPIWNYMYDRTVRELATSETFELRQIPEPRLEPEIVLHLGRAPAPGMSPAKLLECVDWIAPAWEIVYSIFPNWQFSAADAAAAYGVHGALLLGRRQRVPCDHIEKAEDLANFSIEMRGSNGAVASGHARNVLGGPLHALRFLVDEIARHPKCEPIGAGELVTTGTLAPAMPAVAGETWTTTFDGVDLEPIRTTFA